MTKTSSVCLKTFRYSAAATPQHSNISSFPIKSCFDPTNLHFQWTRMDFRLVSDVDLQQLGHPCKTASDPCLCWQPASVTSHGGRRGLTADRLDLGPKMLSQIPGGLGHRSLHTLDQVRGSHSEVVHGSLVGQLRHFASVTLGGLPCQWLEVGRPMMTRPSRILDSIPLMRSIEIFF